MGPWALAHGPLGPGPWVPAHGPWPRASHIGVILVTGQPYRGYSCHGPAISWLFLSRASHIGVILAPGEPYRGYACPAGQPYRGYSSPGPAISGLFPPIPCYSLRGGGRPYHPKGVLAGPGIPRDPKSHLFVTKWVAMTPFGTWGPGTHTEFRRESRQGAPAPSISTFLFTILDSKNAKMTICVNFLKMDHPRDGGFGAPWGPQLPSPLPPKPAA